MKVYIRKVDEQCINKQISILSDVAQNFFEGVPNGTELDFIGDISKVEGKVTILYATDARLGGDIKKIINAEGGMSSNDLILIWKKKTSYVLQLLKNNSDLGKNFLSLFGNAERHLLLDYESGKDQVESYDFNQSSITDAKNLIVYGTPGCGKSYYVEHEILKDYNESNKIRTTFYQDYTNSDFVGQILPHLTKGEDGKDVVTYVFNPGPFTLALEQAVKYPNDKVALVIEELNRGNAASIFGDIFQLLDRKNGVSEYPIKNVNIIDYLNKKFKDVYYFTDIKLPGNLSIFATMNTSDQNVFTLDTAFKRRWKFEKILNTFKDDHEFQNMYVPGADITWKQMVEHINDYILKTANGYGNEDKQLGVYFVDETGMRKDIINKANSQEIKDFAYKVLEYLWDDVAKLQRKIWFDNNIKSLDELVQEYSSKGIEVFNNDIFKDL